MTLILQVVRNLGGGRLLPLRVGCQPQLLHLQLLELFGAARDATVGFELPSGKSLGWFVGFKQQLD